MARYAYKQIWAAYPPICMRRDDYRCVNSRRCDSCRWRKRLWQQRTLGQFGAPASIIASFFVALFSQIRPIWIIFFFFFCSITSQLMSALLLALVNPLVTTCSKQRCLLCWQGMLCKYNQWFVVWDANSWNRIPSMQFSCSTHWCCLLHPSRGGGR